MKNKREKPKSIMEKWKKSFSIEKSKTAGDEKSMPQTNGTTLSLIRKTPITFQLSRLENPKDFELMSFVAKACSKTGDKLFKKVVHVEQTRKGSRLVASDGHRLHVAEISYKIKSGDYKPYTTKDNIMLGEPVPDVKYPAWATAIPLSTTKLGVINLEKSGTGKVHKESEKLSIALRNFSKQTGETVNLRFLNDLTKREWIVYGKSEGQHGIVLREKSKKFSEADDKCPVAVILPLQMAA